MNTKSQKGFSLIEVLVFMSILGLFFVAAASVTLFSLRNMKVSEHRIIATHYAEELLSWMKNEKDANWNDFIEKADSGGYTYCFSSLSWPSDTGDCESGDEISSIYYRKALVTLVNSSQVSVKITVDWNDSNITYSVPLNTIFTLWE